jgi:SAM-dependent methyltransferase
MVAHDQREEAVPMGSAAVQGPLWSRAAHDWAELQEPAAQPLWGAMLTAVAVGPGTRLLDAGCGAGGASALAGGRGAVVNGLDAAEALLAIARARVPDGDFQLGDLEALPYADAVFDVVVAADVLPYVADPLAALRELRRVCAPRGRVVLALWGPPEECAQRAIVLALRALLPPPLDAERGPLGGTLSAPGVLDALVAQAGLALLSSGSVPCTFAYPDAELCWQAQASAGPLQAALRVVGVRALKAAVLGAIAPYTASSGAVRLQNHGYFVVAAPSAAGARRTEPGARKGGTPM